VFLVEDPELKTQFLIPQRGAQKLHGLPLDAIAFVDFGNAQSVTAFCHKGSFERVGLRHDQTVDIAVQYSTATAGTPVTVVPLDGGAIVASGKNLIVAADGTIKNTLGTQSRPPLAHRRKVCLNNEAAEAVCRLTIICNP
jgi:hypothetical protein